MEKKFKLGIIGAGFMATSIAKGAINSGILKPQEIIMSDISESSLINASKLNVNVTTNNLYLANSSEFVLFAIKPQNFSAVADGIKNCDCKKFISIMAGVKRDKIRSFFSACSVARAMPNTPCSIGCGAVGIDISDYSEKKDVDFIYGLFSSFSQTVMLSENKLNAVTGVSGSSPAYFYLFVKSIIDAGVKEGLTVKEAQNLAVNTMIGSGKMIQNNPDKSIEELINAVCSKGGTTIEAVKVYKDGGLAELSEKAVRACVKRSEELENL